MSELDGSHPYAKSDPPLPLLTLRQCAQLLSPPLCMPCLAVCSSYTNAQAGRASASAHARAHARAHASAHAYLLPQ